MEQSKLAKTLNFIITITFLELCAYFIVNHIAKNKTVALLISLALTTIFATEILYYSKIKHNKYNLKKHQLAHKEKCATFFLTQSDEKILNFFNSLFSSNYNLTQINSTALFDKSKEKLIIANFSKLAITDDELIYALKLASKVNAKFVTIFCNELSQTTLKIPSDIELRVVTIDDLFAILTDKNQFPVSSESVQIPANKNKQKLNFRQFLSIKHARPLLICGIFLYLNSFLVPFKLYYCIFAAFCLIFSVINLLFGNKTNREKSLNTAEI